MKDIIYEEHQHPDPKFPIIYHRDWLDCYYEKCSMHYHEGIEVLYFLEGEGNVRCGENQYEVQKGDLIVINSNELHSVAVKHSMLQYYCLIIDRTFCEENGLDVKYNYLQNHIIQTNFDVLIKGIVYEIETREKYYKLKAKNQMMSLLVELYRHHSSSNMENKKQVFNYRMETVKLIITYIKSHITEVIVIEEICKEIGISKFYMCRIFKEVTGQTIVEYINFMKCDYARRLLMTGKYNVKESAEECGFQNLSYFSKTYKKYMGKLPSREHIEESLNI